MMEKIRNFFTTNLLAKILAVVIGVAVWVIIFNIQDPTTTVYVNVPIDYINEDILLSRAQRVFLSGPSTVSVTVTVHTSQSNEVDSSFFSCTADLTSTTGADLTRQSLRTEVTQVGGQGMVLDWSYTRGDPFVTVALDEYVSKSFTVSPKWESTEMEGMKLKDIRFKPDTVTVSGPASKFTNVASVKVPLVLSEVARNLNGGYYEGKVPIKIYDATDTALSNITDFALSSEFVTMFAEIENLASAPLKLSGVPNGTPAEGYYYNGATIMPENVTLLSLREISVDAITVPLSDPAIDISGLTSSIDFTIDLAKYEPEGVNISEETAVVHIEISANSTMSFSFYSVKMENTNAAIYNYALRNRPYISVSGTAAAIAGLTAESFNARVNLSGMGAGTHNVPVNVTLPEGVSIIASNLTAEILVNYVETAPPETTTEEPETEAPTEAPTETSESGGEETTTAPESPTDTPETPSEEVTTEAPTEEPTAAPTEAPTEAPPEESGQEERTEAP